MRLRIQFAKQGPLRYVGNLDLHKIWERTARRAELPLAYSQGFHPHPQIQLAAALPLGFSSHCEFVDLKMSADISLDGLSKRIQNAVPSGLQILSIDQVDDRAPALQTQVVSAEYEVTLLDEVDLDGLAQRLRLVTESESLPRERRGKPYDLRPLIEELTLAHHSPPQNSREGTGVRVFMRLAAREGATGRPEEVLDVLGIPLESTRVERSRLIFRSAD
jgi:radical SAM-linked protein